MKNKVQYFLALFENELNENNVLRNYHRIINSPKLYAFRKAYVQQRMEYVLRNILKPKANILDVGCGYGTTSFLLGMQGHNVIGTTLEYYYEQIQNRFNYWNQYFDTSNIEIRYENLFTSEYQDKEYDYIIVQDTLHHLEPIGDALKIFYSILKDDGKILVCEENGNNLINNLKNFKRRGFKRIIEVYDEKLKQKYLMGNENTRGLSHWKKLFKNHNLDFERGSVEYIRFFPPFYFKNREMNSIIKKEQKLAVKNKLLRKFFFFGLNYSATKL